MHLEKIKANGIAVDTGFTLVVRRWAYKLNLFRHIRYLKAQ